MTLRGFGVRSAARAGVKRSPLRWRLVTAGQAATAIVVFHGAWLVVQPGGAGVTQVFADLALIPAALGAAVACAVAARRELGQSRKAWYLLGAGMASAGLGESIWAFYELILGLDVPFPSVADVFYLAMIPLVAVALLTFPTAPRMVISRVRTALDGVLIVGSLLGVGWATVLGPLYRSGGAGPLEQTVGLAYPVGDLVIIGLTLVVAARATGPQRTRFALIGAGLVLTALADSLFTYLTLIGAFSAGSLVDLGWMAGYLLIGVGAVRRTQDAEMEVDDRSMSTGGIILPSAAVVVATVVIVLRYILDGTLGPFLFWNAASVVLVVVARQFLTLRENVGLTRGLERKVSDRTADLERVVRELAEAKRLQDSFVAHASHELRTPLTNIAVAFQVLERPQLALDRSALDVVAIGRRGAERMGRLVEDLLLASGISDEVVAERVPFDVGPAIRAVLATFEPHWKTVAVDVPDELFALGDPPRLQTVLGHILSNADRFGPLGSCVRVEAKVSDSKVHILVKDEGPGVPQAVRESIFERFYQADAGPDRVQGGLGLGLFLGRQLARAMGGDLTMEDVDGTGCAAHLELAMVVDAPASCGPSTDDESSGSRRVRLDERDAGPSNKGARMGRTNASSPTCEPAGHT
jgi:signal transduction histidine kinase